MTCRSSAPLTVGSLFSGAGGFDLAFERAGMHVAWQSEIEPNACRVLAHHWPRVRNYGDINGIKHTVPAVDVLCGGFPCQDISVAGRRAGLAGERSGLWWQFRRLVDELRPRWVVIENVPGLLSSNGGRDMGTILGALGQLGYWWAYRVLDAQWFGVAQRRRRVFIVGHLGERAAPATVLFEPDRSVGDSPPRRTSGQGVAAGTVPSLTASGRGVSRAGDSRGQDPVVPFDMTQVTSGVNRQRLEPDTPARTLHAAGGAHVISFAQNQRDEVRELGDVAGALAAEPGMKQQTYIAIQDAAMPRDKRQNGIGIAVDAPMYTLDSHGAHAVAFTERTRADGRNFEMSDEVAYAVTNPGAGGRSHSRDIAVFQQSSQAGKGTIGYTPDADTALPVGTQSDRLMLHAAMQVRRLTPLECCRLQGFPDDWLDLDPPLSDSAKYRLMGNSVAIPVVQWIGENIVRFERAAVTPLPAAADALESVGRR